MSQQMNILRCVSCEIFQVQIVKKAKKWECKVCGAKQSIMRVHFQGTAKDCRVNVQSLNMQSRETPGAAEFSKPGQVTQQDNEIDYFHEDFISQVVEAEARNYRKDGDSGTCKKPRLDDFDNEENSSEDSRKENKDENAEDSKLEEKTNFSGSIFADLLDDSDDCERCSESESNLEEKDTVEISNLSGFTSSLEDSSTPNVLSVIGNESKEDIAVENTELEFDDPTVKTSIFEYDGDLDISFEL